MSPALARELLAKTAKRGVKAHPADAVRTLPEGLCLLPGLRLADAARRQPGRGGP
jgi:hypothetical protein